MKINKLSEKEKEVLNKLVNIKRNVYKEQII